MLRSLLIPLLVGLTLAPAANARLPGPQQHVPASQVRDLAQIRSSKVLRVLVNQSRNSSGEVKGEPVGVEHHRLRGLEHYLNARARDGQQIRLKLIPAPRNNCLPPCSVARAIWRPLASCSILRWCVGSVAA